MCVGIPARVIEVFPETDTADVEIGGIVRRAGIHLVDSVKPGQYVILHAGFAIQVLDEEAAKETLELLEQIADPSEDH